MSGSSFTFLSGTLASQFGSAIPPQSMLAYAISVGAPILVTVIVVLWFVTGGEPRKQPEHNPRRRSQRRRNPTLAETGGWPPIRSEPSSSAEQPQS